MKPFYWTGTTNFGDYLNSWLWPRLFPGQLSPDDGIRLVGIGSLLKDTLDLVQGTKVVFGTGSGYGALSSPKIYENWKFYFVRGPLTAKQFELPSEKWIVDGAWCISLLPEYVKPVTSKKGVSFIPHWTSGDSGVWPAICQRTEIKYIDPLAELHTVLKSIAESELVVTESLHGAILADLFRTPWIPARISPKFLDFKYLDFFQSIDVSAEIYNLPLSDFFEHLAAGRSTSNIRYDIGPVPAEGKFPSFPEEASSAKPNNLYRAKIILKRHARNARRQLVASSKPLRNIFPISVWNSKHQIALVDALKKISASKPYLSADSVRAEKIERLAHVTEKLKRDLESGALTGAKLTS